MSSLDILEDRFYVALEISEDNDFQIHFRRSPKSCFINNYLKTGLEAWNANMDIQSALNERKAISYMCACLSKSEETCFQAMKHALRESIEKKQGNYEQMYTVAHAYASNRECSVQEAVCHCLPELLLRKIFPGVIYANTNLPEKRPKMLRSQEQISQLPDESEDIFKRNILDRYMDRPDKLFCNGYYAVLSDFCYAEFLRYYYLAPHIEENNRLPVELSDEILENSFPDQVYPPVIPLMPSKDKLKCRKVQSVVRFFTPNKNKSLNFMPTMYLCYTFLFAENQNLK